MVDTANNPNAEIIGAVAEAMERFRRAERLASEGLINWGDKPEDSGDKTAKAFSAASGALNKFSTGIKTLAGKDDRSLSGMVDKFGGGVSKAVSGFGSLFGPIGSMIGGAAGGVVSALTSVASTVVEFGEGMSAANKNIIDAGLGIRNGLDGIASAAQGANLGINEFSNALLNNVESLRLMAGGAPGGIESVSKTFKMMGKGIGNLDLVDDLRALGYSTEEIVGGISEVGASLNLAGRQYDTKQLAESTDDYLRAQRELTRITGMNSKDQKAAVESNRRNLFVQNKLNAAGANRPVLEKLVGSLGPEFGALAIGGMDKTLGVLESQYPTYTAAIKRLANDVTAGNITGQEELTARYNELLKDPSIAQEIKGVQSTFGSQVGSLYGNLGPMVDLLGATNNALEQQRLAALAGKNGLDANLKNIGGMAGTIASFESLATQLNAALSMLGATLFEVAGPFMGNIADKLTGGIQSMQNYTTAFKEYNKVMQDANATTEDKNAAESKFAEEVKKIFPNSSGKGLFSDIKVMLTEGIRDGVIAAGEKLLELAWNYSTPGMAWNATKSGASYLGKVTGMGAEGGPIPPGTPDNSYTDPMGGVHTPNYALGGIIDPKPGGKIVRVAEAGMPEAVMPLERAGSKLGVKVSGELIDDSRTMPAILDKISSNNDTMNLILGAQRAMLSALEENNRLVRQGNQLVS